jgi:hypothetical protein
VTKSAAWFEEATAAAEMLSAALRRDRAGIRAAAEGLDPLGLAVLLAQWFAQDLRQHGKVSRRNPQEYVVELLVAVEAARRAGR